MTHTLRPLDFLSGSKIPLTLIIMDGVGIGRHDTGDAYWLARPPFIESLFEEARRARRYTEH